MGSSTLPCLVNWDKLGAWWWRQRPQVAFFQARTLKRLQEVCWMNPGEFSSANTATGLLGPARTNRLHCDKQETTFKWRRRVLQASLRSFYSWALFYYSDLRWECRDLRILGAGARLLCSQLRGKKLKTNKNKCKKKTPMWKKMNYQGF